ncbi:unnamed protein product [Pleuronectes platessa]|uniref:Uncharacterized protein n=1 Tax=Pleuronectes platessa TaxID=8262 RepID=A0A9N7VCC0_PLEPL|nr:unnamed protein product [Pleuronectes platessa]
MIHKCGRLWLRGRVVVLQPEEYFSATSVPLTDAPASVSSGRWRVSPPALLSEAQSSQLSEEEVQPAVSSELKVRHKYGAKRVFKLKIKSGFFLDSLRGDRFFFSLVFLGEGGDRRGSGAGCAWSVGAERSARPAGTASEEERERGSVPERRRRDSAGLF